MITLAVFKFTRNLNARLFSFIFVLNRLIRPALIILHVTILPKLAFLLWQLHRISFMGLGSILFSVVIVIAIVPIAHLIFGNVSIHIPQRLQNFLPFIWRRDQRRFFALMYSLFVTGELIVTVTGLFSRINVFIGVNLLWNIGSLLCHRKLGVV